MERERQQCRFNLAPVLLEKKDWSPLRAHLVVIALMCLAIFRTCSSDSITLGPANKKNGLAACCKTQIDKKTHTQYIIHDHTSCRLYHSCEGKRRNYHRLDTSRSTFLLTKKIHCLEFHCTFSDPLEQANKICYHITSETKGQEFKHRTARRTIDEMPHPRWRWELQKQLSVCTLRVSNSATGGASIVTLLPPCGGTTKTSRPVRPSLS